MVRIAGSHPADPGSSPGLGTSFATIQTYYPYPKHKLHRPIDTRASTHIVSPPTLPLSLLLTCSLLSSSPTFFICFFTPRLSTRIRFLSTLWVFATLTFSLWAIDSQSTLHIYRRLFFARHTHSIRALDSHGPVDCSLLSTRHFQRHTQLSIRFVILRLTLLSILSQASLLDAEYPFEGWFFCAVSSLGIGGVRAGLVTAQILWLSLLACFFCFWFDTFHCFLALSRLVGWV